MSTLEVLEHLPFFRTFSNLLFIPQSVFYTYLHAVIVLYAMFTLHKVGMNDFIDSLISTMLTAKIDWVGVTGL